jgi:sugar-specific transcriptional regulator TrmB
MTVKNIDKYHELNLEELNKLGTRELVNALESARKKVVPLDGVETLTQEEIDWNKQQAELQTRLKEALKGREDVSRKEVPKKTQKKKMKY